MQYICLDSRFSRAAYKYDENVSYNYVTMATTSLLLLLFLWLNFFGCCSHFFTHQATYCSNKVCRESTKNFQYKQSSFSTKSSSSLFSLFFTFFHISLSFQYFFFFLFFFKFEPVFPISNSFPHCPTHFYHSFHKLSTLFIISFILFLLSLINAIISFYLSYFFYILMKFSSSFPSVYRHFIISI